MTTDPKDRCEAVSDTGLPCQKKLYHARNGEYWEHAGGHIFASAGTWKSLQEDHYDNTALLSMQPAAHHKADDCDGSYEYCNWRFPPKP